MVCWCFSWHTWDANLTDNSKIGDGFEQWIWQYIHTSNNLFCSNSCPILELSVKFSSQIFHENTNTPLDGTYLAYFGIDIIFYNLCLYFRLSKSLIMSGAIIQGNSRKLTKIWTCSVRKWSPCPRTLWVLHVSIGEFF